MTRWLETDSLSNQDISSALAIGAYTADADRLILVQFFADECAGNGDYVFYVTLRINGAGSSYQLVPTTTAAVASGVTAIGGQSAMIAVRSGDVLTVYLGGLAGDNANPDTTVRWFELAALRPTTADRTLDVSSGGEAGVDWANVGSPTTTVNLSGTTVKTATDVETDTADIQNRLPAALVSGRVDASTGAMAANVVTAAALAADAGTEIAAAVRTELAAELAHLDADVSEAGGLTAQETRDAMKLAPSAGAAAEGSIDDMLADMPATILTTAIAAHDDTPGTVGYLLSLLAGLDFTAVNLVATSDAGEITIKRTLNLVAVVSGLTIPADWTACYWTVKRSTDDLDADALVQILVSNPGDPDDGVQVLMGTALEDESDGSLVVNQALGTVTIALGDASTALLEDAVELVWDVKVHAPGAKTQPGAGTATITTTVTRT